MNPGEGCGGWYLDIHCTLWRFLMREKKNKKINMLGLCENVWFPWQPIMSFSKIRVYYKINHTSVATYIRLLNLAPY